MNAVMPPWLALLLLQSIAPVPVTAMDARSAAADSEIATVVESAQEEMHGHCQEDTEVTNAEAVPSDNLAAECCEDCCEDRCNCECTLACSTNLVALLSPGTFSPTGPEQRIVTLHVSPLHPDTRHRLFRPPIRRALP